MLRQLCAYALTRKSFRYLQQMLDVNYSLRPTFRFLDLDSLDVFIGSICAYVISTELSTRSFVRRVPIAFNTPLQNLPRSIF